MGSKLVGLRDPTKLAGTERRILPLRRLLAKYKNADPAPRPQLAVPVSVIQQLQAERLALPNGERVAAVSDLATIAFFCLLRVGEYTLGEGRNPKRTVQFRWIDVCFYKNGQILPPTSPLAVLLTADLATLTIDNQKNGLRGQVIPVHALRTVICPVQALARRCAAIYGVTADVTAPICTIGGKFGCRTIRAPAMLRGVRRAVRDLGLERVGIRAKDVGTHSLRAGGAMALKLNGADMLSIMKHGRWTSLSFMSYIHNQIAHLSAPLSRMMARPVPFLNVGRLHF